MIRARSNQGHQENQANHGLDGGRETVQSTGGQGGHDVCVVNRAGKVGVRLR